MTTKSRLGLESLEQREVMSVSVVSSVGASPTTSTGLQVLVNVVNPAMGDLFAASAAMQKQGWDLAKGGKV